MKKISAIIGLVSILAVSPVLASTPCSGTSVAKTANLNWTASPGGMPTPGQAYNSSNYGNAPKNSKTECGNLFIFAATPDATIPKTACANYYEPNIYRSFAHQCMNNGQAGSQGLDGGTYPFVQCQRDNNKACTLPK